MFNKIVINSTFFNYKSSIQSIANFRKEPSQPNSSAVVFGVPMRNSSFER